MDYRISWAVEEDAEALGLIHAQPWKAAYKGIVPDEVLDRITAEKRAEYFRNAIANKLEETAVLKVEHESIGFITLGKCRDEDSSAGMGEIWGIYLSPLHYRRGYGGILLSWGIKELAERGFKEASLWVLEENINARSFYEKHNFYHDGAVKDISLGKRLKELRYRRILK